MSFQRNHIDEPSRIEIGLGVYLHKGIYGYVSKKARENLVSRWFIYYCYFRLMLLLELSEIKDLSRLAGQNVGYECSRSIEEIVLSLYLESESSVSGIQRVLRSIFGIEISIGKISEILNDYGNWLPRSEKEVRVSLKFVSDEIFSNGKPVLVTVEPLSGHILSLEEVENRDKETWGISWLEIIEGEEDKVEGIISDNGKGLVEGIKLVFCEELYQEDLFHVIRHLAYLEWLFSKRAYSAISNEYEVFEKLKKSGKNKVFHKNLEAYRLAKQEALKKILIYDNFVYLFRELQRVLEIVDIEKGVLRSKAEVINQIEVILSLMEEIKSETVIKASDDELKEGINYFRNHQENLLRYFDEVEVAKGFLKESIPDEFVRSILVIIYYYNQKLYSACGKQKKYFKEEKDFWKDGLLEFLKEEEFRKLYQTVEDTLLKIIRSSSIVENTNSRLRRFFDSSRGQINQNRLNLIRFYLNHKVFERGRRKGKTSAEIFHKEEKEKQHWLEILSVKDGSAYSGRESKFKKIAA